MAKKDDTLLVAVDDGYAQTKLYGDNPEGKGIVEVDDKTTKKNLETKKRFIMRSSARPGRYGLMDISGSGDIGTYKTGEGEDWTVSEDIESESTQYDGFHTSTMNRVLVSHALMSAGYSGKKVKLITGLPVADFFINGRKNQEQITRKKENLLRKVMSGMPDTLMPVIEDVSVGCQAMSAFIDYFIDDNIKERDVPISKVAIVDIGGRTTDIALIINAAQFDPSRSGTANIGVLDVYTALSDLIKAKFNTRDQYALSYLDKGLRTGKIKMWGKECDISDLVTEAVNEQKTKTIREIERKLGSASDLDKVIFVGGGSELFKLSDTFPNGYQAPDSEFSNARGLYKYARYFG